MPENDTDRITRPARLGWKTADRLATVTLGLLAISVAICALGLTMLFVMATDRCPADCDTSAVEQSIAVTWIGTAAIVAVMIAGIVWSMKNDPTAFFWPLLASPAIVKVWFLGASIAEGAMGQ